MPLVIGKDGLPEWRDWSEEQYRLYLGEVLEKTPAKSSDIPPAPTKVSRAKLLTIVMLLVALSLRKYVDPTSDSAGWETEARHFLSTVSIFGETEESQS